MLLEDKLEFLSKYDYDVNRIQTGGYISEKEVCFILNTDYSNKSFAFVKMGFCAWLQEVCDLLYETGQLKDKITVKQENYGIVFISHARAMLYHEQQVMNNLKKARKHNKRVLDYELQDVRPDEADAYNQAKRRAYEREKILNSVIRYY